MTRNQSKTLNYITRVRPTHSKQFNIVDIPIHPHKAYFVLKYNIHSYHACLV